MYADGLKENFPASAKVFTEMAEEENEHRRRLIEVFRQKFGDHIPLIRRNDVRGFVTHEPLWMVRPLGLDKVRKQAEAMEFETRRFYERAIPRATDASIRKLLGDLAEAERSHISLAQQLGTELLTPGAVAAEEETRRRMFVLQIVQPGLAGLMDGSVSTLAPLFAAAFATHSTWETFLVGLAASVGAGISMGFAEALSDQRPAHRPRPAPAAWHDYRCHDRARRSRPHAALSHLRLLDRYHHRHRHRRRHRRAVGHRLDTVALHGHQIPARRIRGGGRRPDRVRRGHPDRQCLDGAGLVAARGAG
jgi:rubrerythrin